MDKNLRETNNLYVEIMNSIGDNYAKGKLAHVVQICAV